MLKKIKQPYIAPLIEHFEVKMEEGIAAGSGGGGNDNDEGGMFWIYKDNLPSPGFPPGGSASTQ